MTSWSKIAPHEILLHRHCLHAVSATNMMHGLMIYGKLGDQLVAKSGRKQATEK